MKQSVLCSIALASALLTPAALAGSSSKMLRAAEHAALVAACDPSLETVGAGRSSDTTRLSTTERDALSQMNPELEALRAGEFTNREWTIIAVILLVIVVIAVV